MIPTRASLTLGLISLLRPLPGTITKRDFVVASYPKSGNTWFRFVLANLLHDRLLLAPDVNFQTIEAYSPAVGGRYNRDDLHNCFGDLGRPIKTHYNWCRHYQQNHSILLVRSPIQCIPAFANYLDEAHGVRFRDFDRFLKSQRFGLPAWIAFHQSWSKRAQYVIRYEDLLEEPEYWLSAISMHFGWPYTKLEIESAIRKSSRQEMRKSESNGDPYKKAKYQFVRTDGEVRRNTAVTERQHDLISRKAGAMFDELRSGPVNSA